MQMIDRVITASQKDAHVRHLIFALKSNTSALIFSRANT